VSGFFFEVDGKLGFRGQAVLILMEMLVSGPGFFILMEMLACGARIFLSLMGSLVFGVRLV
jgi:hypothetical protein